MNLSKVISKCVAHDRMAQKELVQHFAPYLYGVCLRYIKRPEDAQDALQDAFILIFTNLDKFYSPTAQFKYWARKIAVNSAISKTRRASFNRESSYEKLPESSYHLSNNLEAEDIINTINQLPELQRIVFNLFAIDGYHHKEIAELMNIEIHDSKNALFKARKALQIKISKSQIKTI